jgi:hypothetical protein
MMNPTRKWLRGRSFSPIAFLLALSLAAIPASAQSAHRTRRESNANRKARIARTIAETYSHRWEAAGGGGYERFRSGTFQQRDNQVTFWASTTYSLNPKLGVIGEVRGGYGNAKIGNILPSGNVLTYNPKISEYSFMAGPSYRVVRKEKFSVSVFAEGGLGLGKFAGDSKGLNLDYNLYPNLAFRITPNYLGSTYGGTLQNNKSLNLGLVYRFGKIK